MDGDGLHGQLPQAIADSTRWGTDIDGERGLRSPDRTSKCYVRLETHGGWTGLMEKTAMLNREREERERLLSRYKGADRELIEDAVADHPGLTVAKAIEMLDAFGGL